MKTITITNKEMELVEACVSLMHSNANFADQKAILSLLDKIKEQTTEEVTPTKAHQMLTRVRTDLDRLIAVGESYAHFQSAQATHKYLKKAKKNLEGLS